MTRSGSAPRRPECRWFKRSEPSRPRTALQCGREFAPAGFRTILEGRASVVTDRIRTFTENGVLLESGEELAADVIVTATGLNLKLFGGITVSVDGKALNPAEHVAYRGMMLSGVPNLAFAIGYTDSSWTLKVGLLCEHFCRLLAHMQQYGHDTCIPVAPAMETRPLLDIAAGYVQRSLDQLPCQGTAFPWLMSMSYTDGVRLVRGGPVVDGHLRFSGARGREGVTTYCRPALRPPNGVAH
ncbi:NAD(P)/FAD-dependent oxidoreductase [Streptomyces sp. Li-HN-5-11]|uniref:NAD(P)/FAD-dependent oxidoreductase n=1 Tax=Streptomyces sp. Li-HN-5-11 TaxID=3075432 RepID=UPI0028ADF9B8|nr:NAD(P)/FAD-dependent oxidoreductase [Streptomyces sp. Li-HN-5-11]WNM34769.1 NAD(P)/FAD-dependent oxidoreductase [Streptomyces sp. Li-HN-5-11]